MTGRTSRYFKFSPVLFPTILLTALQQNDMLQWILEEGIARNHSDMSIVKRVFLINFAAIHTSSTVSIRVLPQISQNLIYDLY